MTMADTDIVINPAQGLPPAGLPDVVKITITVDQIVDLSDVYLHACNTPGMVQFTTTNFYF